MEAQLQTMVVQPLVPSNAETEVLPELKSVMMVAHLLMMDALQPALWNVETVQ